MYECSTTYALIDGATFNIPDSALSVSSTYGHPIGNIRLNREGGWSSPGSDVGIGEWVQADFGVLRLVNAVSTQCYHGHPDSRVSAYTIGVSVDGSVANLETIMDSQMDEVVFAGNVQDIDTVIRNELSETLRARLVRLTIVNFNYWASLRWEIYGCGV